MPLNGIVYFMMAGEDVACSESAKEIYNTSRLATCPVIACSTWQI